MRRAEQGGTHKRIKVARQCLFRVGVVYCAAQCRDANRACELVLPWAEHGASFCTPAFSSSSTAFVDPAHAQGSTATPTGQ